jgi:hypothetical protein
MSRGKETLQTQNFDTEAAQLKDPKHGQDRFEQIEVDDLNNRKIFTGLIKESGVTDQNIVELVWINMDYVAIFTSDEDNFLFLEVFTLNDGIHVATEKLKVCGLGNYENIKFKSDPTRQLVAIFLSNSVSLLVSNSSSCP